MPPMPSAILSAPHLGWPHFNRSRLAGFQRPVRDSERPWPQNALLVVDRQSRRLVETPAYWAFRHFSSFVDVGAVRVGLTGAYGDAIAFRNPDGGLVVVLQNAGNQPRTLTLGARGDSLEVDLPAHGWATVIY
jgi:glucosylceramidase